MNDNNENSRISITPNSGNYLDLDKSESKQQAFTDDMHNAAEEQPVEQPSQNKTPKQTQKKAPIKKSGGQSKRPVPPTKKTQYAPRVEQYTCFKTSTPFVAFGILALVVQVVVIALFVFGTVGFFGDDITVVYAVNLVIGLFKTNLATVYRSLIGAAVGVGYFVVLGLAIKQLVTTIKNIVLIIKDRRNLYSAMQKFTRISYDAAETCAFITVLFISSGLLAPGSLSAFMIITLALGGVTVVGKRVVKDLYDAKTPAQVVLGGIKMSVLYLTFCIFAVVLNRPMVHDFIYGCQALFNGNVLSTEGGAASSFYGLYVWILEPVLFTVIAATFMAYLVTSYSSESILRSDRRYAKVMFAVTVITIVLHLIFKVFTVSIVSTFQLAMVWDWLASIAAVYIPLLLAEVVLWVLAAKESDNPY